MDRTWLLLGVVVCWVGFLPRVVHSMITIEASKQQLRSKVDPIIGEQLKKRYEYAARLQYIREDPHLCGPIDASAYYQITIPSDKNPVALVAQSGGCGIAQKAIIASTRIHPPGLVRYLIVLDAEWTGALADETPIRINLSSLQEEDDEEADNDRYSSFGSINTDEDWNTSFGREDDPFLVPTLSSIQEQQQEQKHRPSLLRFQSKEDAYPRYDSYHDYFYSVSDDETLDGNVEETLFYEKIQDDQFFWNKQDDEYDDELSYPNYKKQPIFASTEDDEFAGAVATEDDYPFYYSWEKQQHRQDDPTTRLQGKSFLYSSMTSNDDESIQVTPLTRTTRSLRHPSNSRHHQHHHVDPTEGHQINVAVLHVSFSVGSELLSIILRENNLVGQSGGTKVLLDSRDYKPVSAKAIFLWVLLSASLSACACCCLLLFLNRGFFEEETTQPPSRPVRRRLTHAQVRTNYPAFAYYPESSSSPSSRPCGKSHARSTTTNELQTSSDTSRQPLLQLSSMTSSMMMEDDCSICLDEFSPGVSCRKLPCQHVFHATCIARWLIERSATCPLCKIDLYEEEEEAAAAEGAQETTTTNTTTTSTDGRSFYSLPLWWGPIGRTGQQEPVATTATTPNNAEESRWGSSWWNMGRQRQTSTATQATTATSTITPREQQSSLSSQWWPFSRSVGDSQGSNTAAAASDDHSINDNGRGRWWSLLGRRQPRTPQRPGVTELTEPLLVTSDSASVPEQAHEEGTLTTSTTGGSNENPAEQSDSTNNNNNDVASSLADGPSQEAAPAQEQPESA